MLSSSQKLLAKNEILRQLQFSEIRYLTDPRDTYEGLRNLRHLILSGFPDGWPDAITRIWRSRAALTSLTLCIGRPTIVDLVNMNFSPVAWNAIFEVILSAYGSSLKSFRIENGIFPSQSIQTLCTQCPNLELLSLCPFPFFSKVRRACYAFTFELFLVYWLAHMTRKQESLVPILKDTKLHTLIIQPRNEIEGRKSRGQISVENIRYMMERVPQLRHVIIDMISYKVTTRSSEDVPFLLAMQSHN